MHSTVDDTTLAQLFTEARTHGAWLDKPVDDRLLRRAYELARMGPTASNLSPMRLVFVKSAAAKEKLKPTLAQGNVEKTMRAPATAIVAYDSEFWVQGPTLAPGRDVKSHLLKMPEELRARSAMQSQHLEAGYFILALRALGLDCGPMGGFDAPKVDEAFFAGSTWRSTLLVNIGYGDPTHLRPRAPRLDFEVAARIE